MEAVLVKWIERFLHSFENERTAFAFDLVEEKQRMEYSSDS